jgi:hypothetical protein
MTDRIVKPQDLSRSANEVLVMAALDRGAGHGYQLALDVEERSGGAFRFNHGTLYPILHRLEEKGLVAGSWSDDSRNGRHGASSSGASGRWWRTTDERIRVRASFPV